MKLTSKQKTKAMFYVPVMALGLAAAGLYLGVDSQTPSNLVINEVAFNQSDEADWIEIYNPTISSLSVRGMYLSDRAADQAKSEIKSSAVIPPGGFLTIYADDHEGEDQDLTTNFNISLGETIYLISSDGSTALSQMLVVIDGEGAEDVTIGRYPDGSKNEFMLKPTMNGLNARIDEAQL